MRLLDLTVENIGLYSGKHHFDLTIDSSLGSRRNVVVFRGHNGAGKSTLFQALALAFHGSLSLGDRISQNQYNEYLLNRLHRRITDEVTVASCTGMVAVTFEYVQSGRPLRIRVERHWQRNGRVVQERLALFQNGAPIELSPVDYQNWLNELFPPGRATLVLFDAERLDAFASTELNQDRLAETLRRLLGLDLVERLQADLETFTIKQGGADKIELLRNRAVQHQMAMDKLEIEFKVLENTTAELKAEEEKLEVLLAEQERHLAAEGGAYAERRPIWQERLIVVQQEREEAEGQLRELSGLLLPFTLVPDLCQRLSKRLAEEAQTHRRQIAVEVWQQKMTNVEQVIQEGTLWNDIDLPEMDRKRLDERIVQLLRTMIAANGDDSTPIIHHLAEGEQDKLQDWIAQARHVVPQQIQLLGERLQELLTEQRRIEDDLQRAPTDEALAPIHTEILRLQSALGDVQKRQVQLSEERGAVQFQREDQRRKLQQITTELDTYGAVENQIALAIRSRLALKTYQDALTRQRLAALEKSLVTSFNAICRKERLLPATYIHPDDFQIQLQGPDGHILSLNDFSAGERQLYALALLKALRQVSGQQMPLLIDTPLARLDEVHRLSLIHDYLPIVSEQVLLFVTDAELDVSLMEELEPHAATIYSLHYDLPQQQTKVTCNTQQSALQL